MIATRPVLKAVLLLGFTVLFLGFTEVLFVCVICYRMP